ncbi:MAG TPA: ABC transporter substrate-binding protein [Candidatus Methylacidiphilales bacterium]
MRSILSPVAACLGALAVALTLFSSFSLPVRAQEGGWSDSDTISIGTSLPLSGSFSAVGLETKQGIEAAFNEVNAAGGIGGKKLVLVAANNGYDPLLCVQNTLQFVNSGKIFALCSYVGTPTSLKAQPVWQGAKLPVVGFYTGARALREPFNRYNIHIRASYAAETEAAVAAFTEKLGAKKFALVYQDDSFGEAVRTGAEAALRKRGLAPAASGTFVRGTLGVEEALDKVVPAAPDIVVLAGTYAPLAKAIRLAKERGLRHTVFYTVSFVGPEALATALGDDVDRVVVSEVVPLYTDTSLPMVAPYLAALKGHSPSFPSFEGYLNACVLIEGLRRAGKDPTREAFIDAIETIKAGQLAPKCPIEYGPNDHVGLDLAYLIALEKGKWVELTDWQGLALTK